MGGAILVATGMGFGPLSYQPTPPGTPAWGSKWMKVARWGRTKSFTVS